MEEHNNKLFLCVEAVLNLGVRFPFESMLKALTSCKSDVSEMCLTRQVIMGLL